MSAMTKPVPSLESRVPGTGASKFETRNSGLGGDDPGDRRSFLVAGLAGAAGLGMIAAGWALGRWPDAVIGSIDSIIHSMGGASDSLGTASRQSRDAAGAGTTTGGAQP